jgi:hypothetical protein
MSAAPPSACNASAASVDLPSMKWCAPSFFCELGLAVVDVDCGDFEAHLARVLDRQMPEAANAADCDELRGFRRGFPDRAECRETRAEEGRGVDR